VAARALESRIVVERLEGWLDALGHWVEVSDGVVKRYQAVVPTTWNASPRNAQGQPGPYEQALVGTPVADPTRPTDERPPARAGSA
jgi:Ni,Fe-hydrogenase I large subunit